MPGAGGLAAGVLLDAYVQPSSGRQLCMGTACAATAVIVHSPSFHGDLQAATASSTAAGTAAGSCGAAWRRQRAAAPKWSSRCACAGWRVRASCLNPPHRLPPLCACLQLRLPISAGVAASCLRPLLPRVSLLSTPTLTLSACSPPCKLQRRPASRRHCSPAASYGGRRWRASRSVSAFVSYCRADASAPVAAVIMPAPLPAVGRGEGRAAA